MFSSQHQTISPIIGISIMAFELGNNNNNVKKTGESEEGAVKETIFTRETREDREPRESRETRGERETRDSRDSRESRFQARSPIRNGRSFSLRSNEGRPSEFMARYNELMKNKDAGDSSLIIIDDTSSGIKLSKDRGFLVYVTQLAGAVYWHLIIIETNESPVLIDPVNKYRGGHGNDSHDSLDVMRYQSTYDGVCGPKNKFIRFLDEYIRAEFTGAANYYFTDVTIVPTEVNLDDSDNIRCICYLAEDANWTIAKVERPYCPATISKNARIKGIARFNQDRVQKDLFGQPYRSDLTVEIAEVDKDGGREVLLENETDRLLVTLDGFVTGAYVGPAEDPDYVPVGSPELACFMPEIAITNINTYHDIDEGQFDRAVLALATLPFLNTNEYQFRGFEQSFGAADPSRKLSGFLYGMEWKDNMLPADIEKIDDSASLNNKWLRRIFTGDAADVCVMVKEGGVDFTLGRLLMNIGEGQEQSLNRLLSSVNDISSNLFSKTCKENNRYFTTADVVPKMIRVPTGYFKTKEGNLPIEMIDTLYLLNVIKTNYQEIMWDWFDTTTFGTNMDENEAITRLVNAIEFVTGKQFVMKGFVTKVYLGGEFLKAVYSAVSKGPLAVSMDADISSNFTRGRRRSGRAERKDSLLPDLAVRGRASRQRSDSYDRYSYSGNSYR